MPFCLFFDHCILTRLILMFSLVHRVLAIRLYLSSSRALIATASRCSSTQKKSLIRRSSSSKAFTLCWMGETVCERVPHCGSKFVEGPPPETRGCLGGPGESDTAVKVGSFSGGGRSTGSEKQLDAREVGQGTTLNDCRDCHRSSHGSLEVSSAPYRMI